MKLAIVSGTFFPLPGGVQVQVHNICNKLFEKKYNIDCYIFNKAQIKNNNYKAVLIEGDKKYYKKLCKNFISDEIIKINKFVDFEGNNSLEKILQLTKIPKYFDLLSIDIDGCDYFIFKSLEIYRPKILCIEFNHLIPNEVEFIQKKDFKIKQGSSAKSIIELAKKKNYCLVGCTLSNLLFIENNSE